MKHIICDLNLVVTLTSSGLFSEAAAQEDSFFKKSSEKQPAAKLVCSSTNGILNPQHAST